MFSTPKAQEKKVALFGRTKASRNETNTMQLPLVYPFFVIEFSFEFGQENNNFGLSFYAITKVYILLLG